MDRDAGEFEPTRAAVDAGITSDAQSAMDARAEADAAAARGVPHEAMRKWLLTWGTPDEKPMPTEWLA